MSKKVLIGIGLVTIIAVAIAVIGYYSKIEILVEKRNTLKVVERDWTWWAGRIFTLLRLSDNVTVEFIELTSDIFIERIEEQLKEGDLTIWENVYGVIEGGEAKIVKGLSKSAFSDDIMWYIEETHTLIPTQWGGFYEKHETCKVFFAKGVTSTR